MTCIECGKPIGEGKIYFWGRHGGEWHPVCFWNTNPTVIGMWHNVPHELALLGTKADIMRLMIERGEDREP